MGIGNQIQRFGRWLFNIKPSEVVRYPIDEELIKRDKLIKAQQQQIQARDAQLAKVSAQEMQKRESERSKDYQQEIAKRLREKEKSIRSKRFKHTFSWRYLFNKMGYETKPTNFGKNIEVTDKDDTVVFGHFGDLITADNGYAMITDTQGNILNIAKDFTKLIWKPDALSNYMKRERIPLALDENFNPTLDLEEQEHPDVIYDEKNGEYAETKIRRRPVKEMLIERDESIRSLQRELERLEKMNIDKDHKLQGQNRIIRMLEDRSNLSQKELSSVMKEAMAYEKSISSLHSNYTKISELKALSDSIINSQKEVIEKLLSKLENYGDKTMRELVKAEQQDDLEFYNNILPEKIPMSEPIEKEIKPPAQPGQRMQ